MTSEMQFYRSATAFYENEYLAWQAKAYYCQAHQGKC